jgi:hypothetical protein
VSNLTETLKLIGQDIVQVLKDNGNRPMTQDQLFANRKLMNYSQFGWGFALDKLEKKKVVTVNGFVQSTGDLKYILV